MAIEQREAVGAGRMSRAAYGSDLVVELLASLNIPYVALLPGSSYRGIHDSLVNFDTPGRPEIILVNHEEVGVAIARGYATATGRPMLAALHNVVGLQNAMLGIYSTWAGRIPMMILGGTGPMATPNRPAHLEWTHTALIQGNICRDVVKWDDQPASISSFGESIMRGHRIAMTEPNGPVYLCFDMDLQEAPMTEAMELPDPRRYAPLSPAGPDPASLRQAADLLTGAQWPVIIADGVGRHPEALTSLAELAELLQAPVISTGSRYNIPTAHPLNLTRSRPEVVRRADVILALDVFALDDALREPGEDYEVGGYLIGRDTKIIHINVMDLVQHSQTNEFGPLMPVDVPIGAATRIALPQLVEQCRRALSADSGSRSRIDDRRRAVDALRAEASARGAQNGGRAVVNGAIGMDSVSRQLWELVRDAGVPFTISGSARGNAWQLTEAQQYYGGVAGGGLGLATGAAIGVALAFRDTDRICINMVGDGEFLFTPNSLWSAANLRVPVLTVINNNRSYGSDEGHNSFLARKRGRSIETRGIGIYIEDPDIDIAGLARSFGVEGFGPIEDPSQVRPTLELALNVVAKERRPAVVDIRTGRRDIQ